MDLNSIPWNLILPVLVIQLLLVVVALIDLVRVKSTNGPKWMWALIIVFINIIGPVVYFILGRRND
ncbi:Phospholipase_D-nuclease N-terminal [Psychrobacillus psychrotolerans]|uniref:Phospholipase_D-nuclease N-terminal n=1 Tax=Psychrobacillus psychrotolerans TaxID=126156 RepID=A0A1I5YAH4_9BACI|nr:PLD nuclease N-terminal domain-containing protein [Psychrobacillus psychrotolerans]SFQ41120.1 Phospholipase_D-nuclease N-terminal [Psychrobacillus psychrotolerans]